MTKDKHKTESTVQQQFKQEFFTLLRKYKAVMYVRDNFRSGCAGISVEFDKGSFVDLSLFEDGKEHV